MDITSAIMDQELGRSAFTVERLLYTRTASGTASRSQTFQALGCVHPGAPEMVQPGAATTAVAAAARARRARRSFSAAAGE